MRRLLRPNQLWQIDFIYLKLIGWDWFYLSTILDDYSRYVVSWRLYTTMKADDITSLKRCKTLWQHQAA